MFPSVPLTDVLEFREGPGILARDFRETGIALLRLAGLKHGAALTDGCNYLDPDMVAAKWRQFEVRLGDTLLSASASLGEVATVGEDAVGAVPYTGIIAFRPRDERYLSEFVRFALVEQSFKDQVAAMGVGSVMKHFGPSHLRQMTVSLPPVREQRAIAEVLGALDDKIAANERVISAAEALMIAHVTRMVQTHCSLSDLAVHSKASSNPATLGASDVQHYSLPSFDSDRLPAVEPADAIRSSKFLLSTPSVLLSKLNPRFPRVWHVPTPSGTSLASTEFVVLTPTQVSTSALWATLSQPGLGQELVEKASGTSGSHQRVRPQEILDAEVVDVRALPTAVDELIDSLGRRVHVARIEIQQLAALRDALLPELMSGRLRVKDAEKTVEEVV